MISRISRSVALAALVALFLATPSLAATLLSTASGNIDATGTWSVVDTTGTNAYLNSEAVNTALTTSPVASSTFTPAAETLTAIGVKLASVAAAPSGTITVKLVNSTAPGLRECTQTVNVADLTAINSAPTATTADGGWAILSCSAAPNGTDAYTVTANTSVVSQVNLFSLATTNWSHLLVTTGTQTGGPAAGDKFFVFGKLTGAGTHAAYVVTIDTTALVNYGNVANTSIDPSIAVGQYGTLQFASAASTAYKAEFAGPMVIYNGGIFTQGTNGTPIPASSSATLTLNSTATGDTGIQVRNGGTMNVAGSSGGRNVVKTLLSATATGGVTSSLTTQTATGWLSGDSIYVAGTVKTFQNPANYAGDAATLSGNASTTSLPLTAAVSNTHTADSFSYTSAQTGVHYALNMFADVILLNRNVVIQGGGTNGNGYLYFQPSSTGAMTWVEFSQISGTATAQRGLELDTGPLGSFSLTNFSFVNSQATTLVLAGSNPTFGGTQGNTLLIQHGSFYNTDTAGNNYLITLNPSGSFASFNPYWKMDDIAVVASGMNTYNVIYMAAVNGAFTNISVTGCANGGGTALVMNSFYSSAATNIGGSIGNAFGPITLYTNNGRQDVITLGSGVDGTISGLYLWRGNRFNAGTAGNLTVDPYYEISGSFGLYNTEPDNLTVRNGVIAYESTANGDAVAVQLDAQFGPSIYLDNMELCNNGALGTLTVAGCSNGITLEADVSTGTGDSPGDAHVHLRNSSMLQSSLMWPNAGIQQSFYGPNSFIVQDCNGCSPVKHSAWVPGGLVSYDTAITHASGYSARMTPFISSLSGYIAGTLFTGAGGINVHFGAMLYSNASGFIPGTAFTSWNSVFVSANVSLPQTVCSAASPCQFLNYSNPRSATGALLRMQSAPWQMGTRIAVASGQSAAQACVWIRPSISTDTAPPWGGSAVTYNGDNPRMVVRQNPYMGVQTDTVIGTSSPTAGAWSQFCASLPIAPSDGQFEVVIDADQTLTSNPGGSINVAEWSCTNCGNSNGSQFWWEGVPGGSVAVASGGSSGHSGFVPGPGLQPFGHGVPSQ